MARAADVAVELVATKLALVEALGTLGETYPFFDDDTQRAVLDWAWKSPVEIPEDERENVWVFAEQIENEILEAVGKFLFYRAGRSQRLRARYAEKVGDDG